MHSQDQKIQKELCQLDEDKGGGGGGGGGGGSELAIL